MAQLAIYKGILAYVTGDTGKGVILDNEIEVDFADMGLILDPTDAQVEAAKSGDEIPVDPDEDAELEAFMRQMFEGRVPESTIRGAMEHYRAERPVAQQRRNA